ncbi:MAG: guanylate kinase [Pseudomonadota bacterium]|nr:guanylate kinase [Pseudomonadota bacterium]
MARGTLFVVSAPSGAGKTSLLAAVLKNTNDLDVSISFTTRAPRSKEIPGESYFFVTKKDFMLMQEQDEFLESAEVFGNNYGTGKSWVLDKLAQDRDVVLEIDWQGALQVKEKFPDAILIFILPPSLSALEARLEDRAQDSHQVQLERLSKAKLEISKHKFFDYLIVNDDFKQASLELLSIFMTSRLQQKYQQKRLSKLLDNLS